MPSYPKTPEGQRRREQDLVERRAMYRRGRRYGLTPREAGHLYTDDQAAPILAASLQEPPRLRTWHVAPKNPDVSLPYEREHVSVRLDVESPDGKRESRWVTVAQSEANEANRAFIIGRVEQYVRRSESRYRERNLELVGLSFKGRKLYDRYGREEYG